MDSSVDDHIQTFVISLQRTPERLRQFLANNAAHPGINVFKAVDGEECSIADLAGSGAIAGDIDYTKGAVGCALSHLQLWKYAIDQEVPITICEDDVILHKDFADESQKIIRQLADNWDLILWGWNFDSFLLVDTIPMSSPCLMKFRQNKLRANKSDYLQSTVRPTALRLRNAFGLPCYSISPAGAQKFQNHCFPLTGLQLSIPELNFKMDNYGIDIAMNVFYEHTNSYVCFPPLAVTDNDASVSTVQKQRSHGL